MLFFFLFALQRKKEMLGMVPSKICVQEIINHVEEPAEGQCQALPLHVSPEDVAAEDARLDAELDLPDGPVPLADDCEGLRGESVVATEGFRKGNTRVNLMKSKNCPRGLLFLYFFAVLDLRQCLKLSTSIPWPLVHVAIAG